MSTDIVFTKENLDGAVAHLPSDEKVHKNSLSSVMLEANFCWSCIESMLEIGLVQQPLAKEFRKLNGTKVPAEIVLIGGAAVLANYGFRDMTYDIDAIIRASSSMIDIPTEEAILAMMAKIRENPQEFRFVA